MTATPKDRKRLPTNRIEPDPADPTRRHTLVGVDGKAVPPAELARLRRRLRTPDDSDWLDLSDWPRLDAILVCHTPGCPADGVDVPAVMNENADGVLRAACGGCQRPITDIYEPDPPAASDPPGTVTSGNGKGTPP